MNYVTENITPAKALEYINTNKDNNRPISKSVVHSYADTMKKGKWLLIGLVVLIAIAVAVVAILFGGKDHKKTGICRFFIP